MSVLVCSRRETRSAAGHRHTQMLPAESSPQWVSHWALSFLSRWKCVHRGIEDGYREWDGLFFGSLKQFKVDSSLSLGLLPSLSAYFLLSVFHFPTLRRLFYSLSSLIPAECLLRGFCHLVPGHQSHTKLRKLATAPTQCLQLCCSRLL